MSLSHRFASLLRLRPAETRLVGLLLVHSFLIGFARIFTRSASYALFLAHYGADDLPYVYIGISILATLASLAYLRLSRRLPLARLLVVCAAFLALVSLGLRAGLALAPGSWVVFVLPVWYEVLWTLSNLEFWNLAGRLCDVRQGKRLFGLISAGEQIAIIIGGLLVPGVVALIGTPDLFFMAALAILGVIGVLLATERSYRGALLAPPQEHSNPSPEQVRARWRPDRYLLLLVGTFALVIIAYFYVDQVFYAQAAQQYPTADQMASLIGPFFAAVALFTVLTQMFLMSQIVNRFGVRLALLLNPAGLGVITLAAIAVGLSPKVALLFGLVALMKLYNVTLTIGIDMPVFKILYQPLPAGQRVRTNGLVEGIVYPASIGLAGLGLYVLTNVLRLAVLSMLVVLLAILAAWLILGLLLGRQYLAVLTGALARRRLMAVSIGIDDASTRIVAGRALRSPNPGPVIYALNILADNQPEAYAAALPGLLDHQSPDVRRDVLGRIQQLRLKSALSGVERCARTDPAPLVRGDALRALAVLDPPASQDLVRAALSDPDPQVRTGALVALLSSQDRPDPAATQRLSVLATSDDPSDRILAARILAEARRPSDHGTLRRLIEDPDLRVQRAALAAAGRAATDDLWALIVARLAVPQLTASAVSALAEAGDRVLPYLAAGFDDLHEDSALLGGLAQACGKLGGQRAAALLAAQLMASDAAARGRVLEGLRECAFVAHGADAERVRVQIDSEIERAAWLLAGIVDMHRAAGAYVESAGAPAGCLGQNSPWLGIVHVVRLLEERLDQCRDRLLLLLACVYDRQALDHARDCLASGSAERKAYAVELIDIMVAPATKRGVVPLLETMTAEQRLRRLNAVVPQPALDLEARLLALLDGFDGRPDAWLRASVFYLAGMLRLPGMAVVEYLAASAGTEEPEAVVRESAVQALARLKGENCMLSTIEKVIFLKSAPLFSKTPDEILGEVAAVATEVEVKANELVIGKGEPGDCMYIVVDGQLRVHDGPHLLNYLEPGEFFGEMALLDGVPRMASVTANQDSTLLRVDQEAFYELMEDRPEFARGIISVLSQRLRVDAEQVIELRKQLDQAAKA